VPSGIRILAASPALGEYMPGLNDDLNENLYPDDDTRPEGVEIDDEEEDDDEEWEDSDDDDLDEDDDDLDDDDET
jgi:hypothetical protein